MLRFGRKVWNAYRDYVFGQGRADVPLHVSLDLTYQCNLRCNMCFLYGEHIDGGKPTLETMAKRTELTMEEWRGTLGQLWESGVRNLVITGGEVFVKKGFLDIVDRAKTLGFKISVLSNGSLMNDEGADRLVKSGLDFLRFSLDGDRETHDAICGRPCFDGLMKAIDGIHRAQARAGSDKPELGFETIIQKKNQGQLSRIVEIAHEKGVKRLTMSNVFFVSPSNGNGQGGQPTRFIPNELYQVDVEVVETELAKARKLAKDFDLQLECRMEDRVDVFNMYYDPGFSYLNKCLYPWMVARVNPYGDVIPCTGSTRALGNLLEHSFAEIWNNEPYRAFRRELKQARLFPECLKCNTLAAKRFEIWNWLPKL